jgi:hypothetical protein
MLLFTTTVELKKKAINNIESEWEITDLRIPTKIIRIKLAISPESISTVYPCMVILTPSLYERD